MKGKNRAAQLLAKMRAEKLSKKRKREIAQMGGKAGGRGRKAKGA